MAEWRGPLWVAVSGGVDSMVLLHVLRSMRHPCHVIHIDHGLRGAESDADLLFVKDHCARIGSPFQSEKVDVKTRAEQEHISTQMAARELRYSIFRGLAAEGPHRIALAHNQDDAIETLLLQLMQGMGAHSWQMIPPVVGPFIRPLLEIGRKDILEYAMHHDIAYREDSSNTDPYYLRNRVRMELLPMMEKWRPGVRRSLARTVKFSREIDHLINAHLEEKLTVMGGDGDGTKVAIRSILDHGTPLLELHHLLRPIGFHPDHIEDVAMALENGKVGATFAAGGHEVIVDRDHLLIVPVELSPRSWIIPNMQEIPVDLPLSIEVVQADAIDLQHGRSVAWLDLDSLEFPLEFGLWKNGDRIRPIGLNGSKLVSDILIDSKMPRNEKRKVMVLRSGKKIAWVAGLRVSEEHKARPASRSVVRIAVKGS